MRISDWSSDVCSSDLRRQKAARVAVKPTKEHPMASEHDDGFEPHHASSPTDHVLTELQLYGFRPFQDEPDQIGRASCRERGCQYVSISVVAVTLKKKKKRQTKTHG